MHTRADTAMFSARNGLYEESGENPAAPYVAHGQPHAMSALQHQNR